MNKTAKFWDKTAKRYSKQPIADEAAYQKKLQITQSYLQPDMEVFEFGCGTGSTAIAHAPYVKHIQAIDVSANMLDIARQKAEAANIGNVTFTQATIDDFNVQDESVDVVLGLSILHLLEDWEATITKVHRMLKPGGLFVSSTACIGDMGVLYRLIGLVLPVIGLTGLLPKVKVFTEKELADAVSAAGFDIEHQWRPGKNKAVFIVARKI